MNFKTEWNSIYMHWRHTLCKKYQKCISNCYVFSIWSNILRFLIFNYKWRCEHCSLSRLKIENSPQWYCHTSISTFFTHTNTSYIKIVILNSVGILDDKGIIGQKLEEKLSEFAQFLPIFTLIILDVVIIWSNYQFLQVSVYPFSILPSKYSYSC